MEPTEGTAVLDEPPVPPRDPRRPRGWRAAERRRRFRRRRLIVGLLLVFVVLPVSYLGWSMIGAATTPGNENFKAKWADWLRGHDGGWLVSPLENWYYSSHQPAKGGRPESLNSIPGQRSLSTLVPGASTGRGHLAPPSNLSLLVQPGLPNEGVWQPTGTLIGGHPALYVAQFRADQVFTSEITSAVWIDPTLARVRLVPGAREPGGTWASQPCIGGADAAKAMAAFNGGFRFKDAHGGFFDEGRAAVPLQDGAASMVIYKDGRVAIGAWNRDVRMTPDVESVIQNLTLMVNHGQIDPAIVHNDTSKWGITIKGKIAVARSGVGVTADGALVYVAGPGLTAAGLAESLQRAGAVEAMTLDINPYWVTFNFFDHPDPSNLAQLRGAKLYPTMQRGADRYECPTPESRDFFSVSTS